MTIPNCFYRVSIKALILNDKKEFLLTQEDNGKRELPGWWLDFGENPQKWLTREIQEEMWLTVTHVATQPSYFVTAQFQISIGHSGDTIANWESNWLANIIYHTTVENYNFTPSSECQAIKFCTIGTAKDLDLFSNVRAFIQQYNPNSH